MASTTTTIIKFTPLYGVNAETPALCYLVQLDDFRILLDCGWTPDFDIKLLKPLARVASTIQAVVISHASVYHMGALPYAYANLGLDCPVYMTVPVHRMGQMFMYDAYQSRSRVEAFNTFTLDQVDHVFDTRVRQLKYNQHAALSQGGIVVTPFRAGHMLGGALWRIQKEDETIVYAVDWNHQKERHLNPGVLETLKRPSLLITDAIAYQDQLKRSKRDEQLLTVIMNTCRQGGNVLLPADTAGRCLELMLMLDQHWERNKLVSYSLAFLSNVSYRVTEFCKSLIEWMSDGIVKTFDQSRRNPFDLCHCKLVHSRAELEQLHRPAVVLVTDESLETGFARDLFCDFAAGPQNVVVFTSDTHEGSLAYKLTRAHKHTPRSVIVDQKVATPLSGPALAAYMEQVEADREAARNAQLELEMKEQDKITKQALKDSGVVDADALVDEETVDVNLIAHPALASRAKFVMLPPPKHHTTAQQHKSTSTSVGAFSEELAYGLSITEHRDGELGRLLAKAQEESKEAQEDPGNDDLAPMQVERPQEQDVIPQDYSIQKRQVDIHCRVVSIDLSGRPGLSSIQNLLENVAPRNLILVHGDEAKTQQLAQFCQEKVCERVFTPQREEVLDLTSDINVYQVRLGDQLLSGLEFVSVGEFEVAFVEGDVAYVDQDDDGDAGEGTEGEGDKKGKGKTDTDGDTEMVVTKNPAAPSAATADIPSMQAVPMTALEGHPSVLVGDVKLSDVRIALQRKGFDAEFVSSVLVCGPDGQVQISKERNGRVSVTGALCPEYFTIRQMLYSQFHVF